MYDKIPLSEHSLKERQFAVWSVQKLTFVGAVQERRYSAEWKQPERAPVLLLVCSGINLWLVCSGVYDKIPLSERNLKQLQFSYWSVQEKTYVWSVQEITYFWSVQDDKIPLSKSNLKELQFS